jgi:hypothetical protein
MSTGAAVKVRLDPQVVRDLNDLTEIVGLRRKRALLVNTLLHQAMERYRPAIDDLRGRRNGNGHYG